MAHESTTSPFPLALQACHITAFEPEICRWCCHFYLSKASNVITHIFGQWAFTAFGYVSCRVSSLELYITEASEAEVVNLRNIIGKSCHSHLLRFFCLVFTVLLISQCVHSAEVDEGRKLSAGSDEQELGYGKEGYHKGMGGWKKGGYGHMGGWKGDHGKGGYYGSGHGKGGYGKGYPGHPH